ncbi:MAG TPA: hypothetical protein VHD62_11225 [Opitutaceae bacterium]|nr:hypothetical protein [Opitutaceae bacterium]
MNSRIIAFVTIVGVQALAGALANRIAAPTWAAQRAREPALELPAGVAAGQGATLAMLGGFRGLAADAAWLELQAAWETRDLAATDTLVRLVPAIDPRPVYFWLNGARIVANDLPAWRIEAEGGYAAVPAARHEEIEREQARLALAQLDRALAFHPHNAELRIERANIELVRLGDTAAAAEDYRRAAEQPGAPYYAARLHAEMLRRLGRRAEALAWLVQIHPALPRDEPAAEAELVLARIRALERELGVPAERSYRPAR